MGALTNTDFLPQTNADFLLRITGGGRKKWFLAGIEVLCVEK